MFMNHQSSSSAGDFKWSCCNLAFDRGSKLNYFNSVKIQSSAMKHCKELGKVSCKQLKAAFRKTVEEIIPDMWKKANKN